MGSSPGASTRPAVVPCDTYAGSSIRLPCVLVSIYVYFNFKIKIALISKYKKARSEG